ncbi:ATP-binding protein [Streptomyces sp. NPDC058762]|uniref:ATP-binding protein n=1 Tax=Streptomyces sp. NPDC058762 TaxID=3346629 RepID=UPI0036851232
MRRIAAARLRYCGLEPMTDDVTLIVSELLTNALRHSGTTEISLSITVKDGALSVRVRDGMPGAGSAQRPRDTAESGRGLFLVDALTKGSGGDWGTEDAGAETWCTIPLTKGSTDMEPAAATAPVLRETLLKLPPDSSAVKIARVSGRTRLTMLDWPGNGHAAIAVLGALVDNAVTYGLTGAPGQGLSARLGVTEARELVIDVTDPNPKFPNFTEAVDGTIGRGLWNARQHGAQLSWFVASDFEGKTVRATFQPGPVDL